MCIGSIVASGSIANLTSITSGVSKVATSGGSGGEPMEPPTVQHCAARARTPQWDLAHCSEASPGPMSHLSTAVQWDLLQKPIMANHV